MDAFPCATRSYQSGIPGALVRTGCELRGAFVKTQLLPCDAPKGESIWCASFEKHVSAHAIKQKIASLVSVWHLEQIGFLQPLRKCECMLSRGQAQQ